MIYPKRKPTRLKDYDYSSTGVYFITICSKDKKPIFSRVVGTLKRFVNREVGDNIFQRSYNDHIIRNERDYIEHYTYIENNPLKWESDELY